MVILHALCKAWLELVLIQTPMRRSWRIEEREKNLREEKKENEKKLIEENEYLKKYCSLVVKRFRRIIGYLKIVLV